MKSRQHVAHSAEVPDLQRASLWEPNADMAIASPDRKPGSIPGAELGVIPLVLMRTNSGSQENHPVTHDSSTVGSTSQRSPDHTGTTPAAQEPLGNIPHPACHGKATPCFLWVLRMIVTLSGPVPGLGLEWTM